MRPFAASTEATCCLCILRAQVPTGQTINLTLINYARVGLPTDWTGPGSGGLGTAAVRPKVCYQLADIRERTLSGGETVRTITVCEGGERLTHVYTSSSNSVFVDVIATKILNVHFLLHFEGRFIIMSLFVFAPWNYFPLHQ